MLSIIIPFRDKVELLKKCIRSILKSSYENYEILLVNNCSSKKETENYISKVSENEKIRIIHYGDDFNFSAINKFAAEQASGENLLFLNNDTEIISENWLEEMLKCFKDKEVGAVGAKLLYPDNTIQHMGVMLEEKRLAIHAFRTWKESDVEVGQIKEWSAVTAACMLTRKNLFLEVGGFDEKNLPIAYNDVDYCLRLREKGYKVVVTSGAKLYHFESASRKSDVLAKIFNRKRYDKFLEEQKYMRQRWCKEIAKDPFYDMKYI